MSYSEEGVHTAPVPILSLCLYSYKNHSFSSSLSSPLPPPKKIKPFSRLVLPPGVNGEMYLFIASKKKLKIIETTSSHSNIYRQY